VPGAIEEGDVQDGAVLSQEPVGEEPSQKRREATAVAVEALEGNIPNG